MISRQNPPNSYYLSQSGVLVGVSSVAKVAAVLVLVMLVLLVVSVVVVVVRVTILSDINF